MSVLQKSTDGATRRSAATECPTEPRAGGRTPWASRTAPRACAQQAHRWSPRSARSCPYRPTRRAVPGAASGATPAREQQERLSGAQDRADLATGGARARGRRARITQAFPPRQARSCGFLRGDCRQGIARAGGGQDVNLWGPSWVRRGPRATWASSRRARRRGPRRIVQVQGVAMGIHTPLNQTQPVLSMTSTELKSEKSIPL